MTGPRSRQSLPSTLHFLRCDVVMRVLVMTVRWYTTGFAVRMGFGSVCEGAGCCGVVSVSAAIVEIC